MPSGSTVLKTDGNRLRSRKIHKFMALALAIAASAANCAAQEKADAPTPKQSNVPSTQSSSTEKTQAHDKGDKSKDAQGRNGQGQTSGTSKDRLFFTLPNFLTLTTPTPVPPPPPPHHF